MSVTVIPFFELPSDYITAPGAGSVTVPSGAVGVRVRAQAGGGGSGKRSTGSIDSGPGGGGEFVEKYYALDPTDAGKTISYNNGAGGAGATTTNGVNGGNTTVTGATLVNPISITAHGGSRGAGLTPGAGGTGSTAGDINQSGSAGTNDGSSLPYPGWENAGGDGCPDSTVPGHGGGPAPVGSNGNPGANGAVQFIWS